VTVNNLGPALAPPGRVRHTLRSPPALISGKDNTVPKKKAIFKIVLIAAGVMVFAVAWLALVLGIGLYNSYHGPLRAKQTGKSQAEIQSDERQYALALDRADPGHNFHSSVRYNSRDSVMEITVPTSWHYRRYQERLDAAQLLWSAWAKTHSPGNPDAAYIRVIDLMGNEVGGSAEPGSIIWVQDK
jgi:hypothetical protein